MEINLEKIELVKDRTGVSYKEAKEALEKANGSVVDAIIDIEEAAGAKPEAETVRTFVDNDFVGKVKAAIARGNVSRIMVKRDDDTILNLPLSIGVLGAFVAPWALIVGAIAAAGLNCKVEFVNDKGEVTDVNGTVKAKYEQVKESDLYAGVKEKIDGLNIKEKIDDFDIKEKIDDLGDKIEKFDIKETIDDIGDKIEKFDIKEAIDDIGDKLESLDINKKIDQIKEKLGEILPEEKEAVKEEPEFDVSARTEEAPEPARIRRGTGSGR
ncbi:MAG: DUF4342 domain-containing protein [Mogibacterium sp.]|nr:DUF4342 domain-containing protein [Mogibacterium sp.]